MDLTRAQLGYNPYTITGHAVRAYDQAGTPITSACWILQVPINDLMGEIKVRVRARVGVRVRVRVSIPW